MRSLLGEWKPRLLLCRVFGHWWRTYWVCEVGYAWVSHCRNCPAVCYAPKLPDPPAPPARLQAPATEIHAA